MKIGTGAPGENGDMIDWVIGVPSQADRKVLVESFRRAIDAAECIIRHGCQKAMNDYNFLGLVFLYLIVFMLVYGEISPRKEEYCQIDAKAVDLTPWKHVRLAGVLLLLAVLTIYLFFADTSVLLVK